VGRVLLLAALAAAPLLVTIHAARIASSGTVSGSGAVAAVVAALICADLLSGLVHWFADTWGSESWPVIGPRLLRPFRLHHVNPDDLLRRRFIDCNGDVAVLSTAALSLTFLVPLHSGGASLVAVFVVALAAWLLPTNQVHQWAHQTEPAAVVRLAQRCGLVLDFQRHRVHHVAPFDRQYCILTGWCNRPLGALGVFPALERIVSTLTGAVPRADEQAGQ
jgi:ubiquitin-conjugating enzyme E2 variant